MKAIAGIICSIWLFQTVSLAQDYRNVELLAHWFEDSIITNSSEARFNECFGFAYGGNEFAVIGSTEGTHIFQLTNDNQLIQRAFVRGRFSSTTVIHRDFAVYQHYLYAVCDEGISSLQIIDFQYLPDSVTIAYEDTLQFGRVHNIFIDTLQQKFYSCIHRSTVNTQTIAAPMKIFSLQDPLHLQELWSGPSDVQEVHDIYVREGKAIMNCGYDGLRVYDFTNTNQPQYLDSKTFYQDQGYNHQGWLSPDGTTYVFGDETNGKRVKRCSFDGSQIQINDYFGVNYQNGSVPHNIKITNEFAFVAYYNEGLRVYDLRYHPIPAEVAHYDTYPEDNPYKLNGAWGVYIHLPSKRVIVSDRQHGLFVFGFDYEQMLTAFPRQSTVSIYPNPAVSGQSFTLVQAEKTKNTSWEIIDMTGKVIRNGYFEHYDYMSVPVDFGAGMYLIRFYYTDQSGESRQSSERFIIQ